MTALLLLDDWKMAEELKTEMKGDPKSSMCETFWETVSKVLEQQAVLVAELNRGDGISRTTIDISYASLRRSVEEIVAEGTNIPSKRWFELQFFPNNLEARQALNHTGRYPVKLKVQSRTMRKASMDAPYGLQSWRMMKQLAVLLGERCVFCCQDDKCKVPVGEPQAPVAATQTNRRAPQALDGTHGALDHDVSKCSIIPSCNFFVDIPETVQGSFYFGKPYITLKDATFEQSSPLRHTTEFLHLFYTEYNVDDVGAMLKYHDGGRDHNDSHAWTKICNIIEWLHTQVDFHCSERCVPGQSYLDPEERVFSPLNMALQCMSLERSRRQDEIEQLIKNANSMAAIRKVNDDNPDAGVQEAMLQSTKPVIEELAHAFQKVQFGGEKVCIGKVADTVSMDTIFCTLHKIDPDITQNDVQAFHLMYKKFPKLEAFCKEHCRFGTYMCQVMKCNKSTCQVCAPLRTPAVVFEKLFRWKPHPELVRDGNGRVAKDAHGRTQWRPFDELYAEQDPSNSERDRPMLDTKAGKFEDSQVSHLLTKERCKGYTTCGICSKRRGLYSRGHLDKAGKDRIARVKETLLYTCGSGFCTEEDPTVQDELMIVRRALTCNDPMEQQYYSNTNEAVCCQCSLPSTEKNRLVMDDELLTQWCTVLPLCEACKAQGKVQCRCVMLL